MSTGATAGATADGPAYGPADVRPVRLALSAGDPNGIGAEVMLRALLCPTLPDAFEPIIVGNRAALEQACALVDRSRLRIDGDTLLCDSRPIPIRQVDGPQGWNPGAIDPVAGRVSAESVVAGTTMALAGTVDGLVTMPISKEAWNRGGFNWPGHTELIAQLCDVEEGLMMLMCRDLRVALLTAHVPLARVPALITREKIVRTVTLLATALRRDFACEGSRIGLLGLNPHAGDGGVLGLEEEQVFAPALRQIDREGLAVEGPFPADAYFARRTYRGYDATLAVYHDQGLIPLKMVAGGAGVNVTAGLPIVRTSPDHGTGFDIAGRGVASAQSTIEAITTAVQIVRNRRVAEDRA